MLWTKYNFNAIFHLHYVRESAVHFNKMKKSFILFMSISALIVVCFPIWIIQGITFPIWYPSYYKRREFLETKIRAVLGRFEYDPRSRNGFMTVPEIRKVVKADPEYVESSIWGSVSHVYLNRLVDQGFAKRRKSNIRYETMDDYYFEYKVSRDGTKIEKEDAIWWTPKSIEEAIKSL